MSVLLADAGAAAWLHREAVRDPVWHFPAEALDARLSELRGRAGGMAAALAGHGVGARDRVVTMLDNSSAAICLLLAIWQLGAVPVPLRPKRGDGDHGRLLADIGRTCDMRLAVCADEGACLPSTTRGGRPVIPIGALRGVSRPWRSPAAGAEEVALIQFTSGSTGRPKGVVVTHGMIAAQVGQLAANYARAGHGAPPVSIASWLPFYHDMGLFIGVLLPLYLGTDVMAAPPGYYMRNPLRWFRTMAARGDDLTFSTNSVMAATLRGLRRLRTEACDLSALVLYIAAEKISPLVLDEIDAVLGPLGLAPSRVRTGYGMAEYALGCTSTHGARVNRVTVAIQPGGEIRDSEAAGAMTVVSVGVANPGCKLTICDPFGRVLGERRLGEITLSGPCLSPGYHNDPAATRATMGPSGFRTGDLGFLLHGELYFCARVDEMLVVGGCNIVPGDVELAVEELSFVGVGRSVLFGVADGLNGKQVLLVETPPGLPAALHAERLVVLRRHVLGRFGFVPSVIELVPKGTVEKTSSGKKRTAVIRGRYLAATGMSCPNPVWPPSLHGRDSRRTASSSIAIS